MPLFRYITIDRAGNEVEETIEAADERAAAAALRAQKKVVTSLKEARPIPEKSAYDLSFLDYLSFITTTDIAFFFRQLSSLITSGVTLMNALFVLEEQEKKTRMRKLIGRIRLDIQGGSSLTTALKKHPGHFDPLIVGMIDAGEASGMLNVILERIADYLEQRASFRNEIITGAIYPAIIVIAVVLVISFLAGFVIPKLVPILKMRGTKLPWNTQFLIVSSNWFKAYWIYLFSSIGIVSFLVYISYRSIDSLRYWIDRIKIKLPLIGPVLHYAIIVQFTRNMSTLIESGLSVVESLRIVNGIISNRAAKKVIETMENHVLRGESLSSPIKGASFMFPPMVATMVAVGEETGRMDSSLEVAANIHEKMLNTYVSRLSALIEPVLIVILGGIVGFVAWSLISGVLTMYHV